MGIGKIVNTVLNPLGLKLSRIPGQEDEAEMGRMSPRYDLTAEMVDGMDKGLRRVLNIIEYTKKSGSSYAADPFESAYHSIELDGRSFSGQRKPQDRLEGVDFDFNDAVVLDIGCNQGGMLFEISGSIKYGVGIDYDARMINAANRIRSHRQLSNTDFYVFDLENEDLDFISSLLRGDKVDIVFLLSVCMWIPNWRDVVAKVHALAPHLLFESNGNPGQQEEQEQQLRGLYKSVTMLRDSSPDDPSQQRRKLFLCAR